MPAPDMSASDWIGGIAGTAALALVGWRRILRAWASDRTATVKSEAEANVIEVLQAQVDRLSEQNTKLAALANELQLKMVELGRQNLELQHTVNSLHAELQRFKQAAQG